MALTNKKRYPNTVARRKIASPGVEAQRPPQTPITILGVTVGATSVVTFNQTVFLSKPALWPNNAGNMPLTSSQTASDKVTLTYPASPATTSIIVPFESQAVRNSAGGYVISGTFS